MNKNTGGGAFPLTFTSPNGDGSEAVVYQLGMTLRDYFAAQAMVVMIQNPDTDFQADAEAAYLMADAMLRERAK